MSYERWLMADGARGVGLDGCSETHFIFRHFAWKRRGTLVSGVLLLSDNDRVATDGKHSEGKGHRLELSWGA